MARKVIITSHASLSVFERGGPLAYLDFQKEDLAVIHLLIRDTRPSKFSYVSFYDNCSLVRMSDLTKYVRFDAQSDDLRILCIQIRRRSISDNECLETVFSFLKAHDYISESASMLDYQFARYVDTFLTGKTMDTLSERYGPIIETLRTDDNLSYGLSTNLERWGDYLVAR